MFGYIGKNLINLNEVLSISIMEKIKYVNDNIEVIFKTDKRATFFTETPEKDLENIFKMMKKDNE